MIRIWKIKALFFKIASSNSLSIYCFYYLKTLLYKNRSVPDRLFKSRIKHAKKHIHAYAKQKNKIPETSLEIGTGWYPLVPIYFFLCNVKNIYTIDINQLLTYNQLIKTLEKFSSVEDLLRNSEYVEVKNFEKIKNILNNKNNFNLQSALEYLNITYKVENFADSNISNPIDLLHSNNTLEHIPKEDLYKIIEKSNSVMNYNGVQSHFIDLSDHYSHKNNTMSKLNFLHYSSREWRKYNSYLHYQNRLRPQDYKSIFSAQSLEIVEFTKEMLSLEEQNKLLVHPEFSSYSVADLFVTNLYVILRKAVN